MTAKTSSLPLSRSRGRGVSPRLRKRIVDLPRTIISYSTYFTWASSACWSCMRPLGSSEDKLKDEVDKGVFERGGRIKG
ncbi:hypothetical protein K440DRAFT_626123 [Wilcoxina mikolae CBS 423.85]|nr:hypothetical protein K440DRAFT_626123 [Wilcoxina mikolae CBS 423.85]